MVRLFLVIGCALAFLSVATGAFGAHALARRVEPRMLEVWETASRYQMYHALGLMAAAWLLQQSQATAALVAGYSFVVGVALFSGSLYIMVLSGLRWLGAITPLGGMAMLVGWASLALAAWKLQP